MLSRSVTAQHRELSIELTPLWEFFLGGGGGGKLGKMEDILDWEWGLISDPGDREKRP